MLPSNNSYRVFHGTNLFAAKIIQTHGISLNVQRQLTDFGKGFYVTFNLDQAKSWARVKAINPQVYPKILDFLKISKQHYFNHPYTRIPSYLIFDLNLSQLVQLNGRVFPLPHELGWSHEQKSWELFVQKCRAGVMHSYDYVYGPIGGNHPIVPNQVKVSKSKDQLSLNSIRAIQCLSNLKVATFKSIQPIRTTLSDNERNLKNFLFQEINEKLRDIGNFSRNQSDHIIKKSWLYPWSKKMELPLFHEPASYWAYSILYGTDSLWYEEYENYLVKENN